MRDRTHGQGLDTEEIRRFIAMVDARAIVYSKVSTKFIKSISDGDTGIRYFIPITPAYDSSFDNKVIAFDQLLTCGRERVERDGYHYPIVRNREKLAEMLFTSGTTGTSKCVMLCQKNIFAAVNAAVETVCFSADDVVVSVLPIHHTYELMCIWQEMVYGIEICINDSLRHVMKNFQLFKPTGLVLVPLFINTMYAKIWSEAKKEQEGNHSQGRSCHLQDADGCRHRRTAEDIQVGYGRLRRAAGSHHLRRRQAQS